jgi:hypothetical protein
MEKRTNSGNINLSLLQPLNPFMVHRQSTLGQRDYGSLGDNGLISIDGVSGGHAKVQVDEGHSTVVKHRADHWLLIRGVLTSC